MCIWVHRWSLCPIHQETGHPDHPPDQPLIDPERPWLCWKHGQAADPGLVQKFGLTAPDGFVFVHHQIISKRRCASWASRYCNKAPREIHTQLFKTACSQCTGQDRCDSLNVPYRVDISGHDNLSHEEDSRLERTVAEYWRCELLAKTAQLSEFIPGFDQYDQGPGQLNYNSRCFFFDMACTEDLQHIHALRGETSDCEWCNNVNHAPAHNLTRAIRRQEALGALQSDFDALMRQFDLLESEGEISRLRDLQRGDPMAQDWCPPETQWDRVDAWHLEIARLGHRISQQGPSVEDERFQQRLLDTRTPDHWNKLIMNRTALAQHVATELTHDSGLSETFFGKLFNHVVSLLLPWPAHCYITGGALETRPHGDLITVQMVYSFDRALEGYHEEIMEAFHRSNSMVRDLSLRRDAIVANSKYAAMIIRSDLEACIIDAAEARSHEDFCSICLEPWLHVGNIPAHLAIVALPCCKKPLHGRCLQPLMRARVSKTTCPCCRSNLVDFGLFGPVYQDQVRSEHTIGQGVVPLLSPVHGAPAPDRTEETLEFVQQQQQQSEQVIESSLNMEYSVLAEEIHREVIRSDANGEARNLGTESHSGSNHGESEGGMLDHALCPRPRGAEESVDESMFGNEEGRRMRRAMDGSAVIPSTPTTPKFATGVQPLDTIHFVNAVSHGPRDVDEDTEGLMEAPWDD